MKNSFYARDATPEGVLRLYVDLRVDMDELKTWEPDRMTAFFDGLSAAMRARSNVLPTPAPHQEPRG